MMPLYDGEGLVICNRCGQRDRMIQKTPTHTDFGGVVHLWICRRCGIVAVAVDGERPWVWPGVEETLITPS